MVLMMISQYQLRQQWQPMNQQLLFNNNRWTVERIVQWQFYRAYSPLFTSMVKMESLAAIALLMITLTVGSSSIRIAWEWGRTTMTMCHSLDVTTCHGK